MLPCICIDDTHSMFKVITGAHYWNPIIEKTIKKGDKVYYHYSENGVNICLTDNKDLSFMFLTKSDFKKHFEDLSIRRNKKIKKILK